MTYGISREEALALIQSKIKNRNMINHCLASEAVLQAMAERLGEDREKWGLAGLLHDLDTESQPDLLTHTTETVEILKKKGVDEEIVEAIRLHNLEAHPGEERTTVFQHALAAGETITGLVVATALVYPDKKLASVKPKSVKKRIKEKAFARGANREIIAECEKAGIPLPEFCELSLKALQQIAGELGL
ncbi:phosphohydrolase [Desulfomarina profundi]|uniref:Phosphohydrolase n=1 Tax=Desulfomarina profundi TaxID=2772557 RepID=A0A8D5FT64_9BACT|nr:HDIG domain-containing metalloprotein [Desulfomarina profundi]BCL61269.1 phosphohydrolase [Desulfomarina profundi]